MSRDRFRKLRIVYVFGNVDHLSSFVNMKLLFQLIDQCLIRFLVKNA